MPWKKVGPIYLKLFCIKSTCALEKKKKKALPHDDEVVPKGDGHEGEGGEDALGLLEVRDEIGNVDLGLNRSYLGGI